MITFIYLQVIVQHGLILHYIDVSRVSIKSDYTDLMDTLFV